MQHEVIAQRKFMTERNVNHLQIISDAALCSDCEGTRRIILPFLLRNLKEKLFFSKATLQIIDNYGCSLLYTPSCATKHLAYFWKPIFGQRNLSLDLEVFAGASVCSTLNCGGKNNDFFLVVILFSASSQVPFCISQFHLFP